MFYYVKSILEVPFIKSIGRDWTTEAKGETKLHRGTLRREMSKCVCVCEAKCILCVKRMYEAKYVLCV